MTGRQERQQEKENRFKEKLSRQWLNYYDYLTAGGYLYTTRISYTQKAMRFVKTVGGVKNITFGNVVSYLSKFNEGSDSNKAQVWYALKEYFTYLELNGEIERNFCKDIPATTVKDDIKQVYMDAEELNFVLSNIEKDKISEQWKIRNKAIVRILMVTGIRLSALLELNLSDFDPEKRMLHVVDKGKKVFNKEIDEETNNVLTMWCECREEMLLGMEMDALFLTNRLKRLTEKSVRGIVKKYTKDLEKHITPHKFRSSYASNLYLMTKDPVRVQRSLGHSQLRTTERYIAGLEYNDGETVSLISNLLKK